MLKTKISAIGTAVPQHIIPQSKVVQFMTKMMEIEEQDKRKLRIIYKASGIEERYSVIEDYAKTDDFSFYSDEVKAPAPSTSDRMKLYEESAPKLALEAIEDCLPDNFEVM